MRLLLLCRAHSTAAAFLWYTEIYLLITCSFSDFRQTLLGVSLSILIMGGGVVQVPV